jgi:ATP-dependent DNA helicase RecG
MTATPIPRTLAMTAYADLTVSIIDELPPGRTPVTTAAVPETRREEVIERVRTVCAGQGRQTYWVCTLIDESEVLQAEAAEATAELLTQVLPDLKVGLVHGRMKPKDKQAAMAAFKAGETDLLVATTVIEVGVDVPNASLMVIENAERLGLAQLHQLRGRVGRGATASACLLMYHPPLTRSGRARLAILRESSDGFEVARRDLELRGPGEVLGTRQTGQMLFKVAELTRDEALIDAVDRAGQHVLEKHPGLVQPLVERWLPEGGRYGDV